MNDDVINVCNFCVGETYLKSYIKTQGQNGQCSYCSSSSKTILIEELAELITNCVKDHFEVTPIKPEPFELLNDGHWYRRGEDLQTLIKNYADIPNQDLIADLCEICDLTEYPDYDDNPHYAEARPDLSEQLELWRIFCQELKHSSRFFNTRLEQILDDLFGDISELKTASNTPVIKVIESGLTIYRSRVCFSGKEIERVLKEPYKELGPPPRNIATSGRMNPSGISVLYAALQKETSVAELRPPVGSLVIIAPFKTVRELKVLELDELSELISETSIFDPQTIEDLKRKYFLEKLVYEIQMPILPSDTNLEYLPTQAVAEFLSKKVDGIIYSSSQTKNNEKNIVLFNNASRVKAEPREKHEKVERSVTIFMNSSEEDDTSITIFEEVSKDEEAQNGLNFLDPIYDDYDYQMDHRLESIELDIKNITIQEIHSINYETKDRQFNVHRTTKRESEWLNNKLTGQ